MDNVSHINRRLKLSFLDQAFLACSLVIGCLGMPHWSKVGSMLFASLGMGLFWYSIRRLDKTLPRATVCLAWYALTSLMRFSFATNTTFVGLLVFVLYVLASLWLGGQFALLSFFATPKKMSWMTCLYLPSFWTLLELSRLAIFDGFAFGQLGLSYSSYSVTSQLASTLGIYGLSFWFILTNTLFYLALIKKQKSVCLIWLFVACFPFLFGTLQLSFLKKARVQKSSDPLKVALVQPSLTPFEKNPWFSHKSEYIALSSQLDRLFDQIRNLDRRTHYIVFPETVISYPATSGIYNLSFAESFLEKHFGADFEKYMPKLIYPYAEKVWNKIGITNAFFFQAIANYYNSEVVSSFEWQEPKRNASYLATVHFRPFSSQVSAQYKRVLFPFAETLPKGFLGKLGRKFGAVEGFTRGDRLQVFEGRRKLFSSICYEEFFGNLIRKGKIKGADLFVNLSNDGWYYPSRLPLLHLYHARLRAIENGVDVLRSSNTGITSVISSLGNILSLGGENMEAQHQKGVLQTNFAPYSFQTIYSKWGDLPILILSLCFVGYYLFMTLNQKRNLTALASDV